MEGVIAIEERCGLGIDLCAGPKQPERMTVWQEACGPDIGARFVCRDADGMFMH